MKTCIEESLGESVDDVNEDILWEEFNKFNTRRSSGHINLENLLKGIFMDFDLSDGKQKKRKRKSTTEDPFENGDASGFGKGFEGFSGGSFSSSNIFFSDLSDLFGDSGRRRGGKMEEYHFFADQAHGRERKRGGRGDRKAYGSMDRGRKGGGVKVDKPYNNVSDYHKGKGNRKSVTSKSVTNKGVTSKGATSRGVTSKGGAGVSGKVS